MDEDKILTTDEVTEATSNAAPEAQAEGAANATTTATETDAEKERLRQEVELYKNKFANSTRENQILNATLQQEAERKNKKTPADDDLQSTIPGWDTMTENERVIAKLAYKGLKVSEDLSQELGERRAREQRDREIESFILSDSRLAGREDEFNKFVNKPTHRNAPLEVLKSAFFFDVQPDLKAPVQAQGLETGSGGTRTQPKTGWSAADVEELMKNDPRKYNDMVRKGLISADTIEE